MAFPKGRPIQLRYTDRETGKEVRISTGAYDATIAEEQKKDLEAKLRLGQDARPTKRTKGHINMPWDQFREEYSELHLTTIRSGSAEDAESRLDVVERILKPIRLRDVVSSEALTRLQADLLAGKENPLKRPRSKHTVKSRMAAFVAVLNWAKTMGWIPAVPSFTPIETSKLKKMKGRPLTLEEFERMLSVTPKVVGRQAAESWQYLLRGAIESGLRLDELMNLSWDDPNAIMPMWEEGEFPLLAIPADRQKNDTEESIPLVPGLESLLLETPAADRRDWVFNPKSLQIKRGKRPQHWRPTSKWVGKVICMIGKKAGVIVQPAKGLKPAKFTSMHDLRRTFANQLRKAGVRLDDVAVVIRHASTETTKRYYAPANLEQTGQTIRAAVKGAYLGTRPNPDCRKSNPLKDIRDQDSRFFKPGAAAP
jgi:integrase